MPAHKLPNRNFRFNKNLAYVIGLIVTDGSLSSSRRHIIMTSADKDQLETFCSILKISPSKYIKPQASSGFTKNKIKSKQAYKIQIGNKQFYNWLLTIGLKPNKTKTLKSIKIPDKFFPDFLRGWIDGDGSIFTYIDNYTTYKNKTYQNLRLYVQLVSASKSHLKWLQTTIKRLINIKGALSLQHAKRNKQIWRIRYSKKESIKLLNWIYYQPSLPCLKRKYNIAQPFLVSN